MGMHQMLGPSFGSGADYEIQRSLRFNSADSAYLIKTRHPQAIGRRGLGPTGLKRCGCNNFETIFSAGGSNVNSGLISLFSAQTQVNCSHPSATCRWRGQMEPT